MKFKFKIGNEFVLEKLLYIISVWNERKYFLQKTNIKGIFYPKEENGVINCSPSIYPKFWGLLIPHSGWACLSYLMCLSNFISENN